MKIYVFSDSHGSNKEMIAILKHSPPDAVIHLGDGYRDAEDTSYLYPSIPFYQVPGNCDYQVNAPAVQTLHLEDISLLFSHGHLWQVKQRYDLALALARREEANILLFGHTHKALCEEIDDLWILNPGPAPESYGIITLDQGSINCQIKASFY